MNGVLKIRDSKILKKKEEEDSARLITLNIQIIFNPIKNNNKKKTTTTYLIHIICFSIIIIFTLKFHYLFGSNY